MARIEEITLASRTGAHKRSRSHTRSVVLAVLTTLSAGVSAQTEAAPAPAPAPDRQWLKAVYDQVADSVVLIETELGTGSGFFFHSSRYVATALHVVDDAETIVVGTTNGRRWYARVAAYSRDHDLALLDLDQEVVGARVLNPADGPVEVGETVAVIGHPFSGLAHTLPRLRGLLNWSLTQGIVGAVSGSWLQTDAAINPGNSGGPVLNARGQVLGVVSAKLNDAQGIGLIARVNRLKDLVGRIGRQPPPRHAFSFDGVEFGFVMQWADDTIEGLSLGAGLRVLKRYPVRLRVGFLTGDIEPGAPTILTSRLQRLSTELTFGYALRLSDYLELSPNAGAAVYYDRRHDASLRIDGDAACPSPPCLVAGRVLRSTDSEVRILPMAGISLDIGRLRLGYAYQLDLGDTSRSQHRALFAVNF